MLRRNMLSSASLVSLNKDNNTSSRTPPRSSGCSLVSIGSSLQTSIESNQPSQESHCNKIDVEIATRPRSESVAYEQQNRANLVHCVQCNTKVLTTGVGLVLLAMFFFAHDIPWPRIMTRGLRSRADRWGGAVHPGYFTQDAVASDGHSYNFAAVTDLDQLSAVKDSPKPSFRAYLLPGVLSRDEATGRYSVRLENQRTLVSGHNEAGRGMELSELTVYNNRLLSFDDRSGTVFEILSTPDGSGSYVVPRFAITEGDGDTDKGMKWEWATVKNGELIMGSMGKEYTRPDGSIANRNNLWVAALNDRGEIRRENWEDKFGYVRRLLGASPPGYIWMEAILWSDHLKKWVFLPRRISDTVYNEVEDERKGGNRVILVNEKFTEGDIVEIQIKPGDVDRLHGFSSFAFVPGTRDRHALAVRSVEENCSGAPEDCEQRSYLMVFDIVTGEVLMDEVKFSEEKFEGIEFVNIHTPPPKWHR